MQHVDTRAFAERRLPRDGVGEGGGQGEDVGGGGHLQAPGLFRGHVGGGSHVLARGGEGGAVAGLDDTEVDDAGTVGSEDHIGRFEVAVDEPRTPYGLDRTPHVRQQPPGRRRVDRAALGDDVRESGPRYVLGGDPDQVLIAAAAHEPYDVRPLDAVQRADLPLETLPEQRVFRVFGPDHLDRGQTCPAGGVPAEIDPAHATAAEHRLQPVRARLPRVALPQRDHRRRFHTDRCVGQYFGPAAVLHWHGVPGLSRDACEREISAAHLYGRRVGRIPPGVCGCPLNVLVPGDGSAPRSCADGPAATALRWLIPPNARRAGRFEPHASLRAGGETYFGQMVSAGSSPVKAAAMRSQGAASSWRAWRSSVRPSIRWA